MLKDYIEEFYIQLANLVQDNFITFKKVYTYSLPPFILRLIKQERQLYRQTKSNGTPGLKTLYNNIT